MSPRPKGEELTWGARGAAAWVLLASAGVIASGCSEIAGFEPEVAYLSDASHAFTSCAGALLCDDSPTAARWPEELLQRADGVRATPVCTPARTSGPRGPTLTVKTDAAPPGEALRSWCAGRWFSTPDSGFRLRVAFHLEAGASRMGFGVVGIYFPNMAHLVLELASDRLLLRPFSGNGSARSVEGDTDLGARDDAWHELAVHVDPDGRASIVFDRRLRAKVRFGTIGGGETGLQILDANRTDVAASVSFDDVLVTSY